MAGKKSVDVSKPDKRVRRFARVPSRGLVEDRLYWRIRGYDYDEITEELREVEEIDSQTGALVINAKMVAVKIVHKQVIPDVSAIIFAAKNLISEKYKEKTDMGDGLDNIADAIRDGRARAANR